MLCQLPPPTIVLASFPFPLPITALTALAPSLSDFFPIIAMISASSSSSTSSDSSSSSEISITEALPFEAAFDFDATETGRVGLNLLIVDVPANDDVKSNPNPSSSPSLATGASSYPESSESASGLGFFPHFPRFSLPSGPSFFSVGGFGLGSASLLGWPWVFFCPEGLPLSFGKVGLFFLMMAIMRGCCGDVRDATD